MILKCILTFKYLCSKILNKIQIASIKNSQISKVTYIGYRSSLTETSLGDFSYIGNDCVLVRTTIGKFCSIASNVSIGGASHPILWGSTSPIFTTGYSTLKTKFSTHEFEPYKATTILNDVWIGHGAIIKSGVSIGNGAIIGMGSVVTKDIGDYEIWGGVPARFLKFRFEKDKIQKLIKHQWWNSEYNRLLTLSKYINDIDAFIEELERNESSDG